MKPGGRIRKTRNSSPSTTAGPLRSSAEVRRNRRRDASHQRSPHDLCAKACEPLAHQGSTARRILGNLYKPLHFTSHPFSEKSRCLNRRATAGISLPSPGGGVRREVTKLFGNLLRGRASQQKSDAAAVFSRPPEPQRRFLNCMEQRDRSSAAAWPSGSIPLVRGQSHGTPREGTVFVLSLVTGVCAVPSPSPPRLRTIPARALSLYAVEEMPVHEVNPGKLNVVVEAQATWRPRIRPISIARSRAVQYPLSGSGGPGTLKKGDLVCELDSSFLVISSGTRRSPSSVRRQGVWNAKLSREVPRSPWPNTSKGSSSRTSLP